jgi:hypothetical protein
MPNLIDYQNDTSEFLRDTNHLLTSLPVLNRWINAARNQTALKTGCIECLIAGNCAIGTSAVPGTAIVGTAQPGNNSVQLFQTIAGVEKYPYAYATPFLQANNAGVKAVVEVKQIAISWGSFRPAMVWMPWQDLQSYARSWSTLMSSNPVVWSDTGDGERGEVWLWPVPSVSGVSTLQGSQGEMEWLTSCVPLPLYTANDYEALPDPYTGAIKYKAASYAMLGAQRYGTAQLYNDMWADELGIDRESVDRGKSGNPYYSN